MQAVKDWVRDRFGQDEEATYPWRRGQCSHRAQKLLSRKGAIFALLTLVLAYAMYTFGGAPPELIKDPLADLGHELDITAHHVLGYYPGIKAEQQILLQLLREASIKQRNFTVYVNSTLPPRIDAMANNQQDCSLYQDVQSGLRESETLNYEIGLTLEHVNEESQQVEVAAQEAHRNITDVASTLHQQSLDVTRDKQHQAFNRAIGTMGEIIAILQEIQRRVEVRLQQNKQYEKGLTTVRRAKVVSVKGRSCQLPKNVDQWSQDVEELVYAMLNPQEAMINKASGDGPFPFTYLKRGRDFGKWAFKRFFSLY